MGGDDLSVNIRFRNSVGVNQGNFADSCPGKSLNCVSANTADTKDGNVSSIQFCHAILTNEHGCT
jgi:uncharacterized protein (DUF1499 family)